MPWAPRRVAPKKVEPGKVEPSHTGSTGTPASLHVEQLAVRRGHDPILGPETFTLTGPAVALLTGPDPAARMALAAALTGNLPPERFTITGTVAANGRTSPPLVRAATALAQSWRVRSASDELGRRIAALQWAARDGAGIVVACPGLDSLNAEQQLEVLAAARELTRGGRLVVLTSGAAGIAAESLAEADVTILLTAAGPR